MSVKSLTTASLLLAVCASPLVAQSVAKTPDANVAASLSSTTSQDNISHVPALTNVQITVFDPQAIPAGVNPKSVEIAMAGLEKMKAKVTLLAQNNDGLCFAIRSSEFTSEDLKSSAPHASKHSTCIPASSSKMKSAVAVQAK
jgi:hypothetical protein